MGRIIAVEDRQGYIGLGEVTREDPASIAFAEETAELDLEGQRRNLPAWALLGGEDPTPRAVGQLCFDPLGIEAALADGVQTIKIKNVALATKTRSYALRIDLNGRRELAEAARFEPELIEEPGDLEDRGPAQVPIALDESLSLPGGAARGLELVERGWVQALVLKPVLLGGIAPCLVLAAAARKKGAEVIVTHYLDGPIAHAAATHLAFALPRGRHAHGLGFHAALVRSEVPQLGRGVIHAPSWPGILAPEVRRTMMAKIR